MDPSHGGERGGGKNNVKAVSDVKKRVDREDGFEKEEPCLMVNEEEDSSSLDCLLSCRAPKAADCL